MLTLDTPIENLQNVGPKYSKKLKKLGINTIRDLFFHFPNRYEDLSEISSIKDLQQNQKATIQAKIKDIKLSTSFRKKIKIIEAIAEDETGAIRVVWFNQPFLIETIKPNTVINLSGKVSVDNKSIFLSSPSYEFLNKKDLTHTGRLIPIYPETSGLSSRYLRYLIKPLLNLSYQFSEFLPNKILQEYHLPNLPKALQEIHFPKNQNDLKAARYRLAFDEFFLLQLLTLKEKHKSKQKKSYSIKFNQKIVKSFVDKLPFKLTKDQKIAAWEVLQDMEKDNPMSRLLNGDVGSGKTIVAAIAILESAKKGYQTALMSPTEVLAKQHFQTLENLFEDTGLNITLLTSSGQKSLRKEKISKKEAIKEIEQGKTSIIIGTHALIQEKINFKNLALAIIDEQHRFGVAQRSALQNKIQKTGNQKKAPHLLSMTATPIPRTLALTIYGDLDISFIKQMPSGRQKIITKIIPPKEQQKTYEFIRSQIKNKKQAFVICPLIEESSKLEVKAVTQEYEKLSQKIFPDLKIEMLHGKMKTKEKDRIMKSFQERKNDILISTSVVEVGVDIPNATVMIIEGAERFGLSQLHQFRGRIGRNKDKAYCFLFTESTKQNSNNRLKAMTKFNSGFDLAEKDLQIRGPGDFFGTRQSGLPILNMASINDIQLIKKTRQAAQQVFKNNLINTELSEKLSKLQKNIHLE